jgi:hypothetical protein
MMGAAHDMRGARSALVGAVLDEDVHAQIPRSQRRSSPLRWRGWMR